MSSADLFADPVRQNQDILTKMVDPFDSVIRSAALRLPSAHRFNDNELYNLIHDQWKVIRCFVKSNRSALDPVFTSSDPHFQSLVSFLQDNRYGLKVTGRVEYDMVAKRNRNDGFVELIIYHENIRSMNDEDMKAFIFERCVSELISSFNWKVDLKELVDIFDIDVKYTNKKTAVSTIVRSLFKEATELVYSDRLMFNLVEWMKAFILDGNIAAKINLLKLKIMSHEKQPIYSIVEAV